MCELFSSPLGKVSLGRLSTGNEAGRVVTLRELTPAALPRVARAVEAASGVTHPKLLKVLGLVSDGTRSYVASEYLPGVSLFELIAVTRARRRPMAVSAAVRLIIDALRLVKEAHVLLSATANGPPRLLRAECIWVAEFGDTLLAEAGVSAHLLESAAAGSAEPGQGAEARDMLTAAVELFHLASARLMNGDMCASAKLHLPAPLARVLEDVFAWDPSCGFDSAEGLADALSAMPRTLVGTESLVADEVRRLTGDLLDERRRKLAAPRSGSSTPDTEGATRVYRELLEPSEEAEEATVAIRVTSPATTLDTARPSLPAGHGLSVHAARANAAQPSRSTSTLAPKGARSSRRAAPRSSPRRLVRRPWLVSFIILLPVAVAVCALVRPSWLRAAGDHARAWGQGSSVRAAIRAVETRLRLTWPRTPR